MSGHDFSRAAQQGENRGFSRWGEGKWLVVRTECSGRCGSSNGAVGFCGPMAARLTPSGIACGSTTSHVSARFANKVVSCWRFRIDAGNWGVELLLMN